MTDIKQKAGIKQMTMEAVVIRADGSREELGVVSYWHKNPLKRWAHRLTRSFN